MLRNLGVAVLVFAVLTPAFGAEVPKAPVPQSPFVRVVYAYADAMVKSGRDDHGPEKTGLFLSALDRHALAPLTQRPQAPEGVRPGDRVGSPEGPLVGANPQHDENLLRLLYTLSELSGKPHYRAAADAGVKWFLENARSTNTDLLPWGEHMSWDVVADRPLAANGAEAGTHEFFRPWMLWERCFDLAPEASKRFALGLWQHQIANHQTGAFNRHAGYWSHEAKDAMDFPRHAGFYIRTWAVAYARTQDERFRHAIDILLARYEKKRDPQTGLIESYSGQTNGWPVSTLSLAIDCDGAAQGVPEPLAARLRAFAAREDEIFCGLPHDVKKTGGFLTSVSKSAGKPEAGRTPLWEARYGGSTTAQVGMMCVSRYDNTGRVGYRDLIFGAADAYLDSLPTEGEGPWPATFGHALSLEIAAWRHSAKPAYFERARKLGEIAVEKFWGTNALPRASLKTEHYETITGADTLALALLELHLNILHITAVRCPPNTIDR
ncbi:MAG: hypothetical protein HYY24_07500 [Verrucomicrobia bacterium]|nr:hypothetical protein [Verrucomicrobiota bacterium]